MENQRPLILISNDDGVIAKGISELVKFLRPLGEIVVMAPDAPRSGSASALTVTEPIHYQLVRKDVGLTVYKMFRPPIASSLHCIRCSTANPILWWVVLITAITPRSMCIIPEQWEVVIEGLPERCAFHWFLSLLS